MQKLKNLLLKFPGLDLKILAYLALPIYWVIIITGTFLHLN